jgi:hypothetical protein
MAGNNKRCYLRMKYLTKTDLSLGPQFGSQMGQYAALYSISKKTGHSLIFFEEFMQIHRKVKLYEAFNTLTMPIIAQKKLNLPFSIYKIKNILIDEEIYTLDPHKNWNLQGIFHTYHYWHDNKNELLKEFQFKPEIIKKAKSFLSSFTMPTVSMHFRRTDYLFVSSLNLTPQYYYDAYNLVLDKLNQEVQVIIFSDDIKWCKENITGDNIIYSEGHTQYEDMCIMSLCNHNIIANSTFSWWGAYLNQSPNKIVICPYQYTGPGDFDFINGNYFPPEWNSIKV